mmetsp:Transcript_13830/g.15297  ORF Transcript_13830/g.15297 Transcript_13830/m.15297 type:complete len:275 (+) Transcript_13830:1190-2014(+)
MFFRADNFGDGIERNMISILEISQTGSTERSMVEFNHTLSHLGVIGRIRGILDTIVGNTEIFDHRVHGLLLNSWLPEFAGIERSSIGIVAVHTAVMNRKISDSIDPLNILLQLLGEAQKVHVEANIHHDGMSQYQISGPFFLVNCQIQIRKNDISLSNASINKKIVLMDTSSDNNITELARFLPQVSFNLGNGFLRERNEFFDLLVGQMSSKQGAVIIGDLPEQTIQYIHILLFEGNLEIEMMIVGGLDVINPAPLRSGRRKCQADQGASQNER